MKSLLFSILFFIVLFSCSSSKPSLQTFTPIPIQSDSIEKGDFSDLLIKVNQNYSTEITSQSRAEITKNDATFLYVRVYPVIDNKGCYRISIDKHRQQIVNIAPDCEIEVEE